MSDTYIQRLRRIQTEQAATQMALAYVERNWQKHGIYHEAEMLTPGNFALVARNTEATYYIRLYAEFEGILKDHLTTNFSQYSLCRISQKWIGSSAESYKRKEWLWHAGAAPEDECRS